MLLETIKQLSELQGVSGCEEQVRYEILNKIEGHCIYKVDALGNILAFKKGRHEPKQKLMLSAHMDEVGLIITYAEEDGLLRFSPVGGIDKRVIVGRTVRIGDVYGVIGMKAIHLRSKEEKDKPVDSEKLTIDIGARNREEALNAVSLGDRAVFTSRYSEFGDGFICGRALDDRAGCALMIDLILGELEYDTHFAFTVQEETGTTGAKTAAAQICPDIAIAIETTTAGDLPDAAPSKTVCSLKQGPVLSFMDRGTIYDRSLYQKALEVAKEASIRCQIKAGVYGGNEARSVQVAGNGARVLVVSLPCRYLHTPNCVIHRSDAEETARFLPALIRAFGE